VKRPKNGSEAFFSVTSFKIRPCKQCFFLSFCSIVFRSPHDPPLRHVLHTFFAASPGCAASLCHFFIIELLFPFLFLSDQDLSASSLSHPQGVRASLSPLSLRIPPKKVETHEARVSDRMSSSKTCPFDRLKRFFFRGCPFVWLRLLFPSVCNRLFRSSRSRSLICRLFSCSLLPRFFLTLAVVEQPF